MKPTNSFAFQLQLKNVGLDLNSLISWIQDPSFSAAIHCGHSLRTERTCYCFRCVTRYISQSSVSFAINWPKVQDDLYVIAIILLRVCSNFTNDILCHQRIFILCNWAAHRYQFERAQDQERALEARRLSQGEKTLFTTSLCFCSKPVLMSVENINPKYHAQ